MNKFLGIGRLTTDPEVKYTNGQNGQMAIARYTVAVDRMKQGEADFLRCVAFGKNGEFAEKYLKKGMKVGIEGHIQTGSYKDKDGKNVYTTDIIIDRQEFCEKKSDAAQTEALPQAETDWMNIPEGIDEELPFNR